MVLTFNNTQIVYGFLIFTFCSRVTHAHFEFQKLIFMMCTCMIMRLHVDNSNFVDDMSNLKGYFWVYIYWNEHWIFRDMTTYILKVGLYDCITRCVPYRKYELSVGGRMEISNETCRVWYFHANVNRRFIFSIWNTIWVTLTFSWTYNVKKI